MSRANLAAIAAVVLLAALGWWAFSAISHMRAVQRCLDEGRRNCPELTQP